MIHQGKFDIEIVTDGKKEEVTVVMQKISPIKTANMASEVWANDVYMTGDLVKKAIEYNIIVSPGNLLEKIEEADNGLSLVTDIATEVDKFCSNPRRYQLLYNNGTSTETDSVGNSV